jgi:hypothetical protein
MSEHPGRPVHAFGDRLDRPSGVLRLGPRRIGDFLLVAQLGDDALGSVYRALHTRDGNFLRLRVLQSPELSPKAVLAAARREADRQGTADGEEGCGHRRLHVADGVPYLVWADNNGWTLDFVLARARAGEWGLPIEFALLVAERAAAEIETAYLSCAAGEPPVHGALWPGFVNICSDAAVRVEGFGLLEVIRPALTRPRMWRDVAPYIAPEVREGRPAGQTADVYAIGVLLAELLTGRRASADTPPPRWRADDDFSQDVSLLLRFALADRRERFSSMSELHASLKEVIATCPFEPSPADLALFLYDLLNPESRKVRAPFDGNSTNPLTPDRRLEPASAAVPPATTLAPPVGFVGAPSKQPPGFAAGQSPRLFPLARSWPRVAGLATAIAGLVLAGLPFPPAGSPATVKDQGSPATVSRSATAAEPSVGWTPAVSLAGLASRPASPAPSRPVVHLASGGTNAALRARNIPARQRLEVSQETETLRLKVGLARIAAERLDAERHAADAFDRGREIEREAEELLSRRRYLEARGAFSQALDLFAAAQTRSREERVRQIQLDEVQSR